MSKAFLKENDDLLEELPPLPDPLPPGVTNYITPEGAAAMKEELRHLVEDRRPGLVDAVSKAVKGGVEAEEPARTQKRLLREIEQRIDFLQRRVQTLQVIDPETQDQTRVWFGARVTVEEAGEEASYRIVGVDESDPEKGLISWLSPLARALSSCEIGDLAMLKMPLADRRMRVKAISYEG